jgi:hypothetical protein
VNRYTGWLGSPSDLDSCTGTLVSRRVDFFGSSHLVVNCSSLFVPSRFVLTGESIVFFVLAQSVHPTVGKAALRVAGAAMCGVGLKLFLEILEHFVNFGRRVVLFGNVLVVADDRVGCVKTCFGGRGDATKVGHREKDAKIGIRLFDLGLHCPSATIGGENTCHFNILVRLTKR